MFTKLTTSEKDEFYPTPAAVIDKMLSGINLDYVQTILEPSAGTGAILKGIAEREKYHAFDVDAIEIDPNLRQILAYNFSEEKKKENKNDFFFKSGMKIVHDDFLSYRTYKRYDLIIMNPPFSEGDKHLLKAIKMIEHGGNVACLLNAETILNPYTQTRRDLQKMLDKYNANIEYLGNAFSNAQRKTDVNVALVKIHVEKPDESESEIYEKFKKAENFTDFAASDVTDIAVTDFIKNIVSLYNVEVQSGLELIRQYNALTPYIGRIAGEPGSTPILQLTTYNNMNCYSRVSLVNQYLQAVRKKYWEGLLENPKFTGKLTSKLQEKYRSQVEKISGYEFSEFNILTLQAEMNAQIATGIEQAIYSMFDWLSSQTSWYPECKNNVHYYNGWKTNSAHKIGLKVILPCHGVFSEWDGRPETRRAQEALEDLEKILNFLDGNMTQNVDMKSVLDESFKAGITKKIPLKYFDATFYKKGTVHLNFNCPELVERFNIFVARGRNWLPPYYGQKKYENMTAEEKTTIDDFQGETAYKKVYEQSNYYLAPAVAGNDMLRLE